MNTIKGMIKDLRREETHIGGCTTKGELIIALESLERSVEIPYNATNGDTIKAMFPNLRFGMEYTYMVCVKLPYHSEHDTGLLFDKDWWKAPYNPQQNLSYTDKSGANIANQDVLRSAT